MNGKGQSAVEFVLLIGFMFLVFFVFFFALQSQIVDATQSKDYQILESIGNSVANEFVIAQSSQADFSREFTLPVVSGEYTIRLLSEQELVVSRGDLEYILFLQQPVHGPLYVDGTPNRLYHYDGAFYGSTGDWDSYPSTAGVFLNLPAEECYQHWLRGSCSSAPVECALGNQYGLPVCIPT